jgi:hypothetical protein
LTSIDGATKHLVTDSAGNQHWQILLDAAGIIGPDGSVISGQTRVHETQNINNATVVFDTGFSLPQVPPRVADGIYGNITGAKLQNVTGE